jgi:hypothetical protein
MRRNLVPALCLYALFVSACSLGPREDWATAIRGGFEIATDEPALMVKHSAKVEVIETTIRQEPKPLIASATGIADFDARRARLVEKAGRNAQLIFDDLKVYVQRSKSSIGTSKQRWAVFDYEREPSVDLDDNDRRMSVGAGLISPVLAVELLDGVLTGSIADEGMEMKTGVSTSHYTGKLSPQAAVTKLEDEDRQDGVERLFDTLGVQQDDFPVHVWVDADDNVRAVRYVMRQQKDRVNAFELTLNWEFPGDAPKAREIALPSRAATLRSTRFADFVTEAIREFG